MQLLFLPVSVHSFLFFVANWLAFHDRRSGFPFDPGLPKSAN